MAVDPDVDRLALVDETGTPIGEDYTLAFAVRTVLAHHVGATPTVVVNLSTSLVVEDAARDFGARFVRAPVGEANVARTMRDEGRWSVGRATAASCYRLCTSVATRRWEWPLSCKPLHGLGIASRNWSSSSRGMP
jgi:hypothetical protein